jgi:hypothetical protein
MSNMSCYIFSFSSLDSILSSNLRMSLFVCSARVRVRICITSQRSPRQSPNPVLTVCGNIRARWAK